MADYHNIDSQKLTFHPKRVSQWMDARNDWESARSVYPIYVEISPVGACNHRCTFCSVDYIGYQKRSLELDMLRPRLGEMAQLGIRSVMFAGEGEPTLWKPLPQLLDYCTEVGIDTSLTTNMVPFSKGNVDAFVRNCTWIKTSVNAGTAATYSRVHRTKETDFDRVMRNFEMAVETRNRNGYGCTIGGQTLLLPENADEIATLALALRERGVDYLVVKPYTQSLYGITHEYDGMNFDEYSYLDDQLAELNTETFNVIVRRGAMNKFSEQQRMYSKCYATPFFWAYVMADGSVYGCSAYLTNDDFCYGNLKEQSFKEIWEGEKRRRSFEHVRDKLDISQCRVNCRMDEVNRYLWKLDHPDEHVNFI